MQRYHVNPTTGNPAVCRAEDPARCPFGTHTFIEADCYKFYEQARADYTIPKVWTRKRPDGPARAVPPSRLALFEQWVNPCAQKNRRPDLNAGPPLLQGVR